MLDEGASGKPGYVDGTLMPVPVANKEAFRAWAATMSALFREYGATRVLDGWGDDVPDGKVTDFKRAVKAKDGETRHVRLGRMAVEGCARRRRGAR